MWAYRVRVRRTHHNRIAHYLLRIDKVLQTAPLTTQGSLVSVCKYFYDHVEHYADILRPLRDLMTPYNKSHKLHWTEDASLAFETMKERINACPKLYFIDTNAPIYLHTDTLKYGIGAYLFQVVDGKDQPISYMSTLSKTKLRWSTTDKEAYAIVYALYKFELLLRDVKFTIHTDHNNLTYMLERRSERVNRWQDYLQRFHCNVEHIPGKDNVLADAFSRILDLDAETIQLLTEVVPCEGRLTNDYLYSILDGTDSGGTVQVYREGTQLIRRTFRS